jgi:hypothetical protein
LTWGDDLAAIAPMIDAHANGSEIVFGVRRKRDAGGLMKRFTALTYYRLLEKLGITATGFLIALGSFVITPWALDVRLFTHNAVPSWASIVVPIYLTWRAPF